MQILLPMQVEHNINLKPYNTLNLESIAQNFCTITSEQDLEQFAQLYKLFKQEFPQDKVFFLGQGSNTIFKNEIIRSFVVKIATKGIHILSEDDNQVTIEVDAGEIWRDFVTYCCQKNYWGLENLAAIYGTVGAAPVQNIGAYGQQVKQVIDSVMVFDLDRQEMVNFSNEDCNFSYRNSIFKYQKGNLLIWKVTFKLSKHQQINTSYKALNEMLKEVDLRQITPMDIANKITSLRNQKLPNPKQLGNVGSFFKNPVVTQSHYERLKQFYDDIVAFDDESGKKISAGWLIEKCGFKGKKVQGVGMYDKQALVLVNYSCSSADNILTYAQAVIDCVKNKFEIDLQMEPHIVE